LHRDRLLTFARTIVGLLFGLAIWSGFIAPYTALLARLSEPVIRAFERPAATRLHARGAEMTIDRADFPRGSARPALATGVLTVNLVLLTALFFANQRPWSSENVGRLLVASIALIVIHVGAVVANVQATYALSLGTWSELHYGVVARNFWAGLAHFYLIAGGFGAAFLLWWLLRPVAAEGKPVNRGRGRRR
jgi:hypothetical protein